MKLAPLSNVQNAHDDSVWTAAWVPPPDSSTPPLLLTGSLDETVRLWVPNGPEKLFTNTGHCLGVVSVAAHPSGRLAASASIDSFVRVFDVSTNTTVSTLEAPPSELWQLQFNPQGTMLAAAGGSSSSIKIWDTATWKLTTTLEAPRPPEGSSGVRSSDRSAYKKFVLSVAWSPDGRQIACGSMEGAISVFDVQLSKFLHHLEGHSMPVRSLAYSREHPDSKILFSASDDGHVHMYDAERSGFIASMSGHASWVLSVDSTHDGLGIATGSSDRTVRLWDLKMRAATQVLTSHTDQVWTVAFGPPSRTDVRSCMLASVSDDKSVAFYQYS